MAAQNLLPPWAGKNVRWVFNLNDTQVVFDVVSGTIERNGEWAEDDFCDEEFTESQFIFKYMVLGLECKQRSTDLFDELLDEQANLISGSLPWDGWVGIQIRNNAGQIASYAASGLSVGNWKVDVKGRVERNGFTLPIRCTQFKKLAA